MMENLTFISSMVPLGPIVGLIAKTLWGTITFVVAYYLGRGLRALWGRR